MLKKSLLFLTFTLLGGISMNGCATKNAVKQDSKVAWAGTKEVSKNAWEGTKEVSKDAWDGSKKAINNATN